MYNKYKYSADDEPASLAMIDLALYERLPELITMQSKLRLYCTLANYNDIVRSTPMHKRVYGPTLEKMGREKLMYVPRAIRTTCGLMTYFNDWDIRDRLYITIISDIGDFGLTITDVDSELHAGKRRHLSHYKHPDIQ